MTPPRVVMVEGIPAFRTAALFAGRRQNESLGRSERPPRVSSRGRLRAGDNGCPKDAEEGNVVAHTPQSVCTRRRRRVIVACVWDGASFARSFDSCSSILTMHGGAKSVFVVGRSVRHHGWANPREWEEPSLGSVERTERDSPRDTALAREKACLVRKGRRSRPPSARGSRAHRPWLVRRVSLQKSPGDDRPRISSANALQKERSGSSERGPSSE
jgi:hypothetical protein